MKKTITLLALIFLCANFSFANGSELNINSSSPENSIDIETAEQITNDRIYYWEVKNAHGSGSGYVYSIEKAQEMIAKVSKADFSRVVLVKSKPLK